MELSYLKSQSDDHEVKWNGRSEYISQFAVEPLKPL
jgi:hypothetical protein